MASEQGTRILMFHRIRPAEPVAFGLPDSYRLRGTSLTFEEFARVVVESGPIVPLRAVELALERGDHPPDATVLTFDDGYREHLDVVAPWLASRDETGTFYIATGLHGASERVAVVDAWYWLLDNAERREADIALPCGGRYCGRMDTVEGKLQWVTGTPKTALLDAPREAQAYMLKALAEALDLELPRDLAAQLYMRPGEWPLLAELRMRLGAHSVTHPRLTQVDDATLQREVASSIKTLGGTSTPFAYPDGAMDLRVESTVRSAGATSAVTCIPGTVSEARNAMRLPRVWVAGPHRRKPPRLSRSTVPHHEPSAPVWPPGRGGI